MKKLTISKIYYMFLSFLFLACIAPNLSADLGSLSPTINQHIYPDEWAEAGLEAEDLSGNYPVIAGTIFVSEPNDNDADSINAAINRAYVKHNNYGGIWAVMLQPSVVSAPKES